jgi:hypothetical protein
LAVDDSDQAESGACLGSHYENESHQGLRGAPRRALAEHRAHEDAEVEPGDMDQMAFVNVFAAAQPRAV